MRLSIGLVFCALAACSHSAESDLDQMYECYGVAIRMMMTASASEKTGFSDSNGFKNASTSIAQQYESLIEAEHLRLGMSDEESRSKLKSVAEEALDAIIESSKTADVTNIRSRIEAEQADAQACLAALPSTEE